jgi:hypothetical protein
MAVNYGASVVTNGLLMLADAANPRSYPGSDTTWADLSGNNRNGSLFLSVSYSTAGYFMFGFNRRANFGDLRGTFSTFSIVCWIYSNGNQTANAGICSWDNGGGTVPYGISCRFGSVINELAYTTPGGSLTSSGLIIPNNQWCMVAVSVGETSATLYLNQSSVTQSQSVASFTNTAGVTMAYNTPWLSNFDGRFSAAQIYNRGLSPSEIQQNYNAYVGRYGI